MYGLCHTRQNINNELIANSYGKISSMALDPIEKKPLYHFFPGSYILSVGSYGCNMKCQFCQNYTISQQICPTINVSAQELVNRALAEKNNIGIAFTYNEPTLSYEYMLDVCALTKGSKLKIVIVSNGMIEHEPLKKLISYVDAFNIDLKAFTEHFYMKNGGNIQQVKENIAYIFKAGKHLEITTLIIPNENDSDEEIEKLCQWIAQISPNIPLHLSRFFPRYKMLNTPPTPEKTLFRLYEIAKKFLKYVHLGNI